MGERYKREISDQSKKEFPNRLSSPEKDYLLQMGVAFPLKEVLKKEVQRATQQ